MADDYHFFATKEDLVAALERVESERRLTYYHAGLLVSPVIETYSSLLMWPSLGVHPNGDCVRGERFLVLPIGVGLQVREVPQYRGGVRYAVDELENPGGITFWPGGVFEGRNILAGSVGTAANSAEASELCRWFASRLLRGFSRVGVWRVGLEADASARRGARLITHSVREETSWDLKLDVAI